MDIPELKEMLEETARKVNPNVKGDVAVLKTPEQKQAEKEIESWKGSKNKGVFIPEFKIAKELIKVITSTKQYNGLMFVGEGGIGKTFLTISSIKEYLEPDQWEYLNGYVTPLSFYNALYKNRNRKVIILDDVEGIFHNRIALAILKGALWDSDGSRIVQYSSKSDKATMPQKFIMTAKIIILCNSIPKKNDISTRALITRVIPYKVAFSFKQKLKICKTFVNEDLMLNKETKTRVITLLEKNVSQATKDFNFRTLKKLIAFVQYDDSKAEELFKATTEIDELRQAYLKATARTDVVKSQIALFIEFTGKSRRTFFRIKRGVS